MCRASTIVTEQGHRDVMDSIQPKSIECARCDQLGVLREGVRVRAPIDLYAARERCHRVSFDADARDPLARALDQCGPCPAEGVQHLLRAIELKLLNIGPDEMRWVRQHETIPPMDALILVTEAVDLAVRDYSLRRLQRTPPYPCCTPSVYRVCQMCATQVEPVPHEISP